MSETNATADEILDAVAIRLPTRTRRAIVTGGTTGIGRYTAAALARDGFDVAITYANSPGEGRATVDAIERLGQRAVLQKLDTSQPATAGPAVDAMVEALGGLDVFVNNAGVMFNQQFVDMTLDKLTEIFNINTIGAAVAMQRAARHMVGIESDPAEQSAVQTAMQTARWLIGGREVEPRQTPGRIIVITSVHGRFASPADAPYTMTKHALEGLVQCAAIELGRYNITVNAVAPGEITTPMNDMEASDAQDTSREAIPAGRAGHPVEIADTVAFLASDRSSFTTGASYLVDGGFRAANPLAAAEYRKMV